MYQTIINATDLLKIIDKKSTVIIDCRNSNATENGEIAYEKAHLPNAFYAHLEQDLSGEIIKGLTGRHPFPTVENFEKTCSKWGITSDSQVVVYDWNNGGIAARLWFMLKWCGHENVALLNGGWENWQKEDLVISNQKPNYKNSNFKAKINANLLVDVFQIEQNSAAANFTLIDARAAFRYRGESEPIDPIAGHIPTALSFPYTENVDANHLFISKEKLQKRFDAIIHRNKNTVIYCGSGVTACHNILALHHIGYDKVKLYPGSWSEWIIDESREVVVEN
jgi:thiosulfate/3-mercaptopyruvate sulfurtransferase